MSGFEKRREARAGDFDIFPKKKKKKQQEAFKTPREGHPFLLLSTPTLFLLGRPEDLNWGQAEDLSF